MTPEPSPELYDIITDRPPTDEDGRWDLCYVRTLNGFGYWCEVDVNIVRRHWGTYYTAWAKLKGDKR